MYVGDGSFLFNPFKVNGDTIKLMEIKHCRLAMVQRYRLYHDLLAQHVSNQIVFIRTKGIQCKPPNQVNSVAGKYL